MEYAIIILLITGITLLILSFFKKDTSKQVEVQLENFSIQLMKELYQIKKKMKVLEEELMISDKRD
jgi:hypothetical protein